MLSNQVSWAPYTGLPTIAALTNADYSHQPVWYYNFRYEEERARGLDCEEDLAAPGIFSWDLANGKAALALTTKEHAAATLSANVKPVELLNKIRESELKRREMFRSKLDAAADAYIVERQQTAIGFDACFGQQATRHVVLGVLQAVIEHVRHVVVAEAIRWLDLDALGHAGGALFRRDREQAIGIDSEGDADARRSRRHRRNA